MNTSDSREDVSSVFPGVLEKAGQSEVVALLAVGGAKISNILVVHAMIVIFLDHFFEYAIENV